MAEYELRGVDIWGSFPPTARSEQEGPLSAATIMADVPFIHDLADVQTSAIGAGTKIWQFCVVLSGARIGADCNICAQCFIENDVTVGDRCTIKNGVQLWDGITLEDDVFVGPNVTFTNDLYPKSRRAPGDEFTALSKTLVKAGASIGGGAVILPGVSIGAGAMIGAGAVVAENVPDGATVIGAKARMRHLAGDAQ